MSRVLVTGAGGFIGSRATDALVNAGHDVWAVSSRGLDRVEGARWMKGDLLDPTAARELIAQVRPEWLLHFAWTAKPGVYWTSPENVQWIEATLRLLREFADRGGSRAVLAGTCAEYAWDGESGVCAEGSTPLSPETLYGISKNATRAVCEAFAAEVGVDLCWGRIFFLYGPAEPQARLVPSVARALLEGREAPVSDGTQMRDFLHVDDVAAGFVTLLKSNLTGAVNIGSGRGVAVREVVELIGRAVGRPELVQFGALAPRPGEPTELVADIGRLRDEAGFEPRITLEDGIAATVAWWRQALTTTTLAPR
jgi:nucleoside-diphosphate-sugar epimerase